MNGFANGIKVCFALRSAATLDVGWEKLLFWPLYFGRHLLYKREMRLQSPAPRKINCVMNDAKDRFMGITAKENANGPRQTLQRLPGAIVCIEGIAS